MAELATASGVAGLLSLVFDVIQAAGKYIYAVSSSNRDVLDILDVLTSLQAILIRLQKQSSDVELIPIVGPRPQALSVATIHACEERLNELRNTLESHLNDKGHLKKRHALAWPIRGDHTKDLLHSLERQRDIFHTALSADILDVSISTHRKIEKHQADSHLHDVARWLHPNGTPSPPRLDIEIDTLRHLRTKQSFRDWLGASGDMIWCYGDSGCGKTTLVSLLHQNWSTLSVSNTRHPLVYFFNYQIASLQSAESVARCILAQIVEGDGVVPPEVETLYADANRGSKQPSKTIVMDTLIRVVRSRPDTAILIDAFDEAQHHPEHLSMLRSAAAEGASVLITSRKTPNLADFFGQNRQLDVTPSDDDMRELINIQLGEVEDDLGLHDEFKRQISDNIINRCSGIFLLVRLFLEDLTRLTTKKEVRESLTKSPSTLSEMYRKIMDQIGRSKHARLADRIIRWVIHAGRPLRIHELQHGLAIESGMLEMDKDNLTSRKTILSSCLGLITLDHDGTVRPVHASLFEFLSCDDIDSTKIACTELGRACLSYLSLKIFATGPCTTADELEARIAYHPLAVYAAQSLGYHCRSVEDDFITQLISLLNDEKTCASCVQLFHRQEIRDDALRGKTFTMLPKGQTALQLACAMGLVCTSRQLIGMGHDLTAPDFQGWRPLNTAVCYGHKNIVSMLLEAGALLECHDAHGWTPLIWSVLKGHVDVARVLLNAGADISISDKSGWTAMHWAASIGESDMIAVLSPAWDTHLQQIKQSYTAADKLLDPLPVAVAHSNIPAFGMMLDGHRQSSRALPNKAIYMILAKLNSSLTHGLAARSFVFPERFAAKILDSAICRDHLSTVRLLVGRGAARTTYRKLNGRSAIYTAMLCRTPEIPRLLISHGYDLGSTDRDGYSVLDIAARNGTLEVIKSLLNMSSTSIVTRSGRTSPLHQIWANTRLLLNHGIEVSRSAKQCTAHPDLTNEEARKIQKRLLHCRFEIAELLLGMGADINGLDDKGQSPVFHALTSGIEAVEFFQTRGAIMNSADSAGNNLLHYSIVLAILPET